MQELSIETEVKLSIPDAESGNTLLHAHGFQVAKPRVFEQNTLYDTAQGTLRECGIALRLRIAGEQATVTQKGPAVRGRHKSREENEVSVSDATACHKIFAALGYTPAFRYEKFRTELARAGDTGHVLLDETPVGCFLELEGAGDWIDRLAKELGFPESVYITDSYATLYRNYCQTRQITPTHMIFEDNPSL